MEYAYATCILSESGEEINEQNLTAVLEAAGCTVQESRVKAIVAALEDIDVGDVTAVDLDGSEPRSLQRGDQAVPDGEDGVVVGVGPIEEEEVEFTDVDGDDDREAADDGDRPDGVFEEPREGE